MGMPDGSAGHYPTGLSLDRIMTEMRQGPLREHVWPKFPHDNPARVLGVSHGAGRPG